MTQDASSAWPAPRGASRASGGKGASAGSRAVRDDAPGNHPEKAQRISSSSTSNTSTLCGGMLPTPWAP